MKCTCRWYVDSIPIRVFRNYQKSYGVAYPTSRPMYAYSSIWAAEDWATQGGRVKTDWSKAPFVANYQEHPPRHLRVRLRRLQYQLPGSGCGAQQWGMPAEPQAAGADEEPAIYDSCVDSKRWTNGIKPTECGLPQY